MKKLLKGLFIFMKVIIVLCLIFLSTYTILGIIVPALQNGGNFIDIIKDMAIYIWASIKSLVA